MWKSAFVHYIGKQVFLVASALSVAFLPSFRHISLWAAAGLSWRLCVSWVALLHCIAFVASGRQPKIVGVAKSRHCCRSVKKISARFCSHFGTNVESLRLHFVLHPTTSGIRHCYFLLVCLFWLQTRWWHFVARYSPRNKFVSQWKNEPVIHIDDISSHPSISSPLWCVFSDYLTMSTRQPMFVPVLQFVLCWRWWIWTTSPWSSAPGWRPPGDHSSSRSKYDRRFAFSGLRFQKIKTSTALPANNMFTGKAVEALKHPFVAHVRGVPAGS